MRLTSVRPGDLVLVDIRGDRFHAEVAGPGHDRTLEVHPIANGRSPLRYVTARQVIGHWRRAGRERARP